MRFSTSTRPLALLLIALLAAFALPAVAAADGKDVLRDCAQDGDLDEDYSDEELEDAYENMPSDIDEYSNCRDVIRQAQAGGRGGTDGEPDDGGAEAGGGSDDGGADSDYRGSEAGDDVAPEGGTPEDQQELDNRADDARNGNEPDGETAVDTLASDASDDDDSGLPTAALVAIILLALAAIGGGLYAIRDRLPGSGAGPGQGR
jgi:hypothetical protein